MPVNISYTENKQVVLKNYECETYSIDKYYLCWVREKNAPKSIELQNFRYDFTKMVKKQVGNPRKINEVIVTSATVSTMVKFTKKNETSVKKSFNFGVAVNTSVKMDFGIGMVDLKASMTKNRSKTEENKESTENMETTGVECVAEEKKIVKCISSITDYKVTVPYTADLIVMDYEGREILNYNKPLSEMKNPEKKPLQINGVFEAVSSGSIQIRNCCVNENGMCCDGTEKEGADQNRPHCINQPKDLICSELEKCFKKPENDKSPEIKKPDNEVVATAQSSSSIKYTPVDK